MKSLTGAVLTAFALYSATLIGIELQSSQDYVRQFFTDIEGDVPFYAVNTTLSVFLLTGSALLLVFAVLSGPPGAGGRRDRQDWLLLSQAGIFAWLAFDDRFQIHEALAYRIGVEDHFVMLIWAAIELGLLVWLCRPAQVTLKCAALFAAGSALFGVMMIFDAIVPHDMVLRLSIEDLAKTWAALMFFGVGWFAARRRLGLDLGEPALAVVLPWQPGRRVSRNSGQRT